MDVHGSEKTEGQREHDPSGQDEHREHRGTEGHREEISIGQKDTSACIPYLFKERRIKLGLAFVLCSF
jgi:hypothetical protein